MQFDRRAHILATIVCLAVVPVALLQLLNCDDKLTKFDSSSDRDSREFALKVGTSIVKAARSSPRKIELVDYSYEAVKTDRKRLNLKMTYAGAITKVKFKVNVSILLNTEHDKKWEVLSIRYSDSNRSPIPYSQRKVQLLIKRFNE